MSIQPTVEATPIAGLAVITPFCHRDERGWFVEVYNRDRYEEVLGGRHEFMQDNVSVSRRGVLRGLHYQLPPSPQGKLVRVSTGEVFDVAVDIRRSSPTFGQWYGSILSAANLRQLWIPEGFAHGYIALTDEAELVYKTTGHYDLAAERSIKWDDPAIGITWPINGEDPLVSPRDAAAPLLADAEVFD